MKNRSQHIIGRLITLNLIILLAAIFWYTNQAQTSRNIALAKGQNLYTIGAMGQTAVIPPQSILTQLAANQQIQFINNIPLTPGEARHWQDTGCKRDNCTHLTLYNYTTGGTIEAILNTNTNQILSQWADTLARPGASRHIPI